MELLLCYQHILTAPRLSGTHIVNHHDCLGPRLLFTKTRSYTDLCRITIDFLQSHSGCKKVALNLNRLYLSVAICNTTHALYATLVVVST